MYSLGQNAVAHKSGHMLSNPTSPDWLKFVQHYAALVFSEAVVK